MNNYIKFIEEMYLRGVITKETDSHKNCAKIMRNIRVNVQRKTVLSKLPGLYE